MFHVREASAALFWRRVENITHVAPVLMREIFQKVAFTPGSSHSNVMSLLKTLRVAFLALLLNSEGLNSQNPPSPDALDACPGYTATNVKAHGAVLTADLNLQETGCKIYGKDINTLALRVVYETGNDTLCCFRQEYILNQPYRHPHPRQNHRPG